MRMPGFTAEYTLGTSRGFYRAKGQAPAARAAGAHPAVIRDREPERKDGVQCRNCDGSSFLCPLNTRCIRLCTTNGQGFAYCE